MSWMWQKPILWDSRDKAQARWYHCSLIGRTIFARSAAHAVESSPTTTQHQRDLASQIYKLSEELEQSLRNERINC